MDETTRCNLTPPLARRPLDGVRVADFSQAMVGSLGTMLLAWMGAEVIKVESITRIDMARNPAHISESYKACGFNVPNQPIRLFHTILAIS